MSACTAQVGKLLGMCTSAVSSVSKCEYVCIVCDAHVCVSVYMCMDFSMLHFSTFPVHDCTYLVRLFSASALVYLLLSNWCGTILLLAHSRVVVSPHNLSVLFLCNGSRLSTIAVLCQNQHQLRFVNARVCKLVAKYRF